MTREPEDRVQHFDLHDAKGNHNTTCAGRTVDFDLHEKALTKHLAWHASQEPWQRARWAIKVMIFTDDIMTQKEAEELALHEAKLAARRHRRNDRVLSVSWDVMDWSVTEPTRRKN